MNPPSSDFLRTLMETHSPAGFEQQASRVWRTEAATFADRVDADSHGNSYAVVHPEGSPRIMLAGHIDEIGVIVAHIDDDGFIYIGPIGGWDPQVLVGHRIRFLARNGDVVGVVGKKPVHLQKPDEREKAVKIADLWVDIGAASGDEARQRLGVGDPGVIDTRVLDLPNGRIASRAIDDRIGAFVVLDALRRYATALGSARVVAVATTQEEIGFHGGGALIAASRLNPTMGIAVDVTHASDHPNVEKKDLGEHKLGGGPVLARGSVVSPVVYRLLCDTAERLSIPYSVQAAGRETNTDADFIQLAREGVATALVSVPNRYMHSPSEMVSLEDLDRAAMLIAETCRGIRPETDFTLR